MDATETAIKRLSSPDPASRSTVAKGRRIRRVDGGFEVINYHVYRSTSLRDAEAERKRLYRQKRKGSPSNSPVKSKREERRERERGPDTVRKRPDNVRTPAAPPPRKSGSSGLIEEETPKGLEFKQSDELRDLKREHNDLIRLADSERELSRRQRKREDVLAQAARVRERYEQVKADLK
jgi:hypothetical protein